MMCARSLFLGIIFDLSKTNQQQQFVAIADDNNSGGNSLGNERQSVDSCRVQPFCVPPNFIDKNTTIDADFARKKLPFPPIF